MIPIYNYLILGAIIFSLSFAGLVVNRKNIITILMCVELMLLSVNINFVAFSEYLHIMDGQVVVFFVLTVAAAESAIGLALLVLLYRARATISTAALDQLKG